MSTPRRELQVYFDTAGSQSDSPMLVPVGVASTPSKFRRLDEEWLATYAKYEIKHFHTADAYQGTGDFEGITDASGKKDAARRFRLIEELAKITSQYVERMFVVAVVREDYELVNRRYKLTEGIGGAYSYAQTVAMYEMIAYAKADCRRRKIGGERYLVHHTCEAGDNGQRQFVKFWHDQFGVDINLAPKIDPVSGEDFTPLAAADLIAYFHRRLYKKAFAQGRRLPPMREWEPTLRILRGKIPAAPSFLEESAFQHYVDHLGIDKRNDTTTQRA